MYNNTKKKILNPTKQPKNSSRKYNQIKANK